MQKGVRFTLRLVESLNALLASEAEKRGTTKQALIIQILWEYVEGGANDGRP